MLVSSTRPSDLSIQALSKDIKEEKYSVSHAASSKYMTASIKNKFTHAHARTLVHTHTHAGTHACTHARYNRIAKHHKHSTIQTVDIVKENTREKEKDENNKASACAICKTCHQFWGS